jgi:hypothetical protein
MYDPRPHLAFARTAMAERVKPESQLPDRVDALDAENMSTGQTNS